jgi:hypothetical protein
MSGKYDLRVSRELIEMMEAESKVNVNWSYNVKILKGSCQKYNLNKDLVKVLHRRLCSSIGTIVTGFTKATITSKSGEVSTCSSVVGFFNGHGGLPVQYEAHCPMQHVQD